MSAPEQTTETTSTPSLIHSGAYGEITSQINALLSNNKQASLSIYDDAEGTTPTLDEAGTPIVDLQVTSVSITQSYIDSVTNAPVNASVTISFVDNSFKVIDDVHQYYYTVQGTDFPLRTL
jgi:hypothetical protein